MTGDHDLFGTPAEPVPCNRVGCWCATYDRAADGPLIDLPSQPCPACVSEHPGARCDMPSLLDGGESC